MSDFFNELKASVQEAVEIKQGINAKYSGTALPVRVRRGADFLYIREY
ncbi:hypothetical protein [Thiomicrorhabdus cannonii]|nr:hypothetical protein [Thiomicrorhabdus cannonii]